jgi:hypothetical protein
MKGEVPNLNLISPILLTTIARGTQDEHITNASFYARCSAQAGLVPFQSPLMRQMHLLDFRSPLMRQMHLLDLRCRFIHEILHSMYYFA